MKVVKITLKRVRQEFQMRWGTGTECSDTDLPS